MKNNWRIAELTRYSQPKRSRIMEDLNRAGITTRDGREWLLYDRDTEYCRLSLNVFSRDRFFVYRSKGLYERLKAWQERWQEAGLPEALTLKQIGEENYTENSLKNQLWNMAQAARTKAALPVRKDEMKKEEPVDLDHIDDTLRPYQADAKRKIISAWEKHRSILLQMPTGTGKTRLFVSMIADIRKQKASAGVLIVTHREELVQQISESLWLHYGLKHGILQGKNTRDLEQPIVVASIQSLVNDKWKMENLQFIIIDEAHHCLAESYTALWKRYPDARKLGVTATPYRLKRASFGDWFDTLITSASMKDFIADGYLSEYRYYTVSSRRSSLQRINRLTKAGADGDYQKKDLDETCNNEPEIEFLYHCYRQYAAGKKGIVYAVNINHAAQITDYFKARGVKAANVDSKTKHTERVKLIADFREGKLEVLCNVDLFTEGFDCPDIEFVMLARPTRSLALYLQQVGRALRPFGFPLNQTIILDCVGLHGRFGLPDRDREWEVHFEGGKPLRPYNKPLGSNENIPVGEMQEVGLRAYRTITLMESDWALATDGYGRSYIVNERHQRLSPYSFQNLTREADGNYKATFCNGSKEHRIGTFRFTPQLQLIPAGSQEIVGCKVYRMQPGAGCYYTLDCAIDTIFYPEAKPWSDYWLELSQGRYTNRDIYPQVRNLLPPTQLLVAENRDENEDENEWLIDKQTLYQREGLSYQLVPGGFQIYYRQSEAEGAQLYDPLLRKIWEGEKIEVHSGYALLYNKGTDPPHTFSYFDYLFDNKF